MATTTFSAGTVVESGWLNDVDSATYDSFINIKAPSYGAIGDGTTDDTAAIQAAIDAFGIYGGRVYMPAGLYLITNTITIDAAVHLIGDGAIHTGTDRGATTLLKRGNFPGIKITGGNARLENFVILGDTGNGDDGILVNDGRIHIENVASSSHGGDGIVIGVQSGTALNCNLWFLANIKCKSNTGNGLTIDDVNGTLGSANCNGGTLVHADLQYNLGYGLYIDNAQLNTFNGVVTQSNGPAGVKIGANARYNSFFGGDYEHPVGNAIEITSGATHNGFYGGVVGPGPVSDSGTSTIFLGLAATGFQGLKLPNITTANVNILDYYQEGTFTPVLTFSTPGDLSVTYAASGQLGTYTRIGNRVMIDVVIETSAFTHTTASGELRITGLPFPAAGGTGHYGRDQCLYQGYTSATRPVVGVQVPNGASYVAFRASGSGVAIGNVATTEIPSGGTPAFGFSLTYQV